MWYNLASYGAEIVITQPFAGNGRSLSPTGVTKSAW